MTTQDDISVTNGEMEMGFHCRVCKTRFKAIPTSEVHRQRDKKMLDENVRLIVAEHIQTCSHPEAVAKGKKAGGSSKH